MPDVIKRVPAFGFETKNLHAGNAEKILDIDYKALNIMKAAGYIPVLGSAVGMWRLTLMIWLEPNKAEHVSRANMIFRGIVETSSLGSVILPFDLGVTAGRKIKQLRDHAK